MTRVFFVAALGLVATSATGQTDLPTFDFKGFVAGQVAPDELLKDCRTFDSQQVCTNLEDTVAGLPAATSIVLYQGRLSSLEGDAPTRFYPNLIDAFSKKYGRPCKTETAIWQNRIGAKLDNPVSVWCFKTGRFEVRQLGSTMDRMSFTYSDENQAPRPSPTIDF